MTTVEARAVEDAIWDIQHGYALAALAVLLHLQESSHLTHGRLVPMARQETM
jgi:hypothetical protein